ncbi:MAG: hypothetical protein AAF558_05510 [Verrucomicrobiota bacterium]
MIHETETHPDAIIRKVAGPAARAKDPLKVAWELHLRMRSLNLKSSSHGERIRKVVGPSH